MSFKDLGIEARKAASDKAEDMGKLIDAKTKALYTENIGIGVRKEDKDLLESMNNALKEIIEDGTYEEISNRWFGTNILTK